jgi:hypothetical protein
MAGSSTEEEPFGIPVQDALGKIHRIGNGPIQSRFLLRCREKMWRCNV